MNTFSLRSILSGSLVMIIMFLSSCHQESVTPNEPIGSADLSKQLDYTENHLSVLAEAALQAANKPSFKELVYSEVEQQFDGDYDVLFEKIAGMYDMSKDQKFLESLHAFKNIEGEDYFPQIYIPFYESLKELKHTGNARVLSADSDPIIVLNYGDAGKTEVPGFRLDEKGELVDVGFLIDEEYAENNEVWVISINERFFGGTNGPVEQSNISGRTLSSPSAIVDQIKCKCNKEDWLNGASEVNMITVVSDYNLDNTDISLNGGHDHQGGCIYKFSRKDVKKKRNKDVNFYILNNWNERAPDMPYGHYVIFEYDPWPVKKRDAVWTIGGDEVTWQYRSSDDYYDKNTVYNSDFAYYSVNNSCIEWSSQYQ